MIADLLRSLFQALYSFVVQVACLALVIWIMVSVLRTILGGRR